MERGVSGLFTGLPACPLSFLKSEEAFVVVWAVCVLLFCQSMNLEKVQMIAYLR